MMMMMITRKFQHYIYIVTETLDLSEQTTRRRKKKVVKKTHKKKLQ